MTYVVGYTTTPNYKTANLSVLSISVSKEEGKSPVSETELLINPFQSFPAVKSKDFQLKRGQSCWLTFVITSLTLNRLLIA